MKRLVLVAMLSVLGVLAFGIGVDIVSVTPSASIVGNTIDTPDFSIEFSFPTDSLGAIKQISFVITNKTKNALKIVWDSSAFVDPDGNSHKVMHQGVRYIERDKSIPPSILVPGTKLSDMIYPTDYINLVNNEWVESSIVSSKPGQRFSVLLAIDNGDQIQSYVITFQTKGQVAANAGAAERIGIGIMIYGQAVYGDKGQIIGYKGYNILFGNAVKNYFDTVNGMKRGQINWFWEFGTVIMIIPYVGIGGDWVIPISETGDFVITIQTMYFLPYLGFSIGF